MQSTNVLDLRIREPFFVAGHLVLALDDSARYPEWVTPRRSLFPTDNPETDGSNCCYFKVAR